MKDPQDVTGTWSGIYNYPRKVPPNAFKAVLYEQNGSFSGETVEASPGRRYGEKPAHALVHGTRSGATIAFVKHYDAAHRVDTPVQYTGTISADGDEITGHWTIPGHWSGTFIMVRRTGSGEAVENRVAETVR